MKKKLLILSVLLVLIGTSKYSAVGVINLYQQYISPHKGWKCAYGIAHPDEVSCSEFGKEAIRNFGVVNGLQLLRKRFKECEKSYCALGGEKNSNNASCCFGKSGPIKPDMIDGSKVEGSITFAYEYNISHPPSEVLWGDAFVEGVKKCQSWGFQKATFFDASVKNCLDPPTCENFRVIRKCTCENY
ncbi:MAG: hypothetical protein RL757_3338 [Bacteroidota bacterium]|jgi:putative component of membrane protein insertase Oxa1/YidC/SpoIIIJ protein YidD